MRIENTNLQPLSAKPAETATPIERRDDVGETESTRSGQDKVEMSENARLLAKARAALGSTEDVNAERVALLKQQIESGDYTVKVGELARKLLAKVFTK
jgi:flagellar biosynthesis anti-sigma factor FlgM